MNTNFKFAVSRIKEEYGKQQKKAPFNKYIVLYRSIKLCILNKDLPHNWLLPSTRILAQELNFSRTTVNKAYELLQLEKLIVSKAGSGNKVNHNESNYGNGNKFLKNVQKDKNYPQLSQKGKSFEKNISLINRLNNKNLAFRPGLPPIDVFPVNQWKKLLGAYWRQIKSSGLAYSQSTGLKELKISICNYLNINRNIKCHHDQIIIVSGSLQSLYLITTTLIDKGDHIILEDPTFPNVHSIFKSQEANILGAKLDDDGVDLNEVESFSHLRPKLIHTTPSNHYPQGVKMSLNRRKDLLKWASINKALIIENDYENEIGNTKNSLPSIYSLDTEDRTIYMGTFNRLLHPSIRLGYMLVPQYIAPAVEALQEHSHRFVAPSIQVVMTQFIERNYLFQHIKNISQVAQERYTLFLSEFEKDNRIMYIDKKEFCSLHVVAKFIKPTSEKEELELVEKLSNYNIVVYPFSKCFIGKTKEQGLILGYSAVRPNEIKQKVKLMKEVLHK